MRDAYWRAYFAPAGDSGADSGGSGDSGAADGGTGGADVGDAGSNAGDGGDAGNGAIVTVNPFSQPSETWRDNVIEALAPADDKAREKFTNQVSRYTDPVQLILSGFEAQDRIRRGEVSSGLPENPSEEQLASYRAANGIPTEAGEYRTAEGTVLSDADKTVIDTLKPIIHKHNIPQKAFEEAVSGLLGAQQAQHDLMVTRDVDDTRTTEAALKDLWGGQFKAYRDLISGQLMRRLGDEDREALLNARGPDGKALWNRVGIMQMFAQVFNETDPLDVVVPVDGDQIGSLEAEIKQLEAKMGTPEWYKDAASNDRLDQLYEQREKYYARQR